MQNLSDDHIFLALRTGHGSPLLVASAKGLHPRVLHETFEGFVSHLSWNIRANCLAVLKFMVSHQLSTTWLNRRIENQITSEASLARQLQDTTAALDRERDTQRELVAKHSEALKIAKRQEEHSRAESCELRQGLSERVEEIGNIYTQLWSAQAELAAQVHKDNQSAVRMSELEAQLLAQTREVEVVCEEKEAALNRAKKAERPTKRLRTKIMALANDPDESESLADANAGPVGCKRRREDSVVEGSSLKKVRTSHDSERSTSPDLGEQVVPIMATALPGQVTPFPLNSPGGSRLSAATPAERAVGLDHRGGLARLDRANGDIKLKRAKITKMDADLQAAMRRNALLEQRLRYRTSELVQARSRLQKLASAGSSETAPDRERIGSDSDSDSVDLAPRPSVPFTGLYNQNRFYRGDAIAAGSDSSSSSETDHASKMSVDTDTRLERFYDLASLIDEQPAHDWNEELGVTHFDNSDDNIDDTRNWTPSGPEDNDDAESDGGLSLAGSWAGSEVSSTARSFTIPGRSPEDPLLYGLVTSGDDWEPYRISARTWNPCPEYDE